MSNNIWLLLERGYSRRGILEEMQIVYGDECPFSAFKDLEREINQWVKGTPPDLYATGIGMLPERWERCRKLKGGIY